MYIPVVYEDEDLVVVDKPTGVPTHATDPGDPYPADALRVVQAQTGRPYLGMHQRLDAETSGVLLFAGRRAANVGLARAFEGRAVEKSYLALVHGKPPRPEGVIDVPIARERGERYRPAAASDPHGLPARTHYRVRETLAGGALARLELTPETGRPHQIRVHLAALGCPVVGDPLYDPLQRPAPRLCLHAQRLALPHPTTGQPLTFVAPAADWWTLMPAVLPAVGGQVRDLAGRAPAALRGLLQIAIGRRAALAADPRVTIYRLVHATADGVAGLTVDRYGDALVVSFYDETEPLPPCPPTLIEMLGELTGCRSIYVKHRPKQASRLTDEQLAARAPGRPIFGPDLAELVAHEDGLAYLIRPGAGLSVGLFPDMRETRGRVRAWAAGRRVLNCFAYTCGFGVAASMTGAARVLNLDLSRSALEWGKANYRANGLPADDHDFVFGDVFDWLARLARRHEQFDLVILDPPGFSRTKTTRFAAAQDYGDLAGLAARVVAADGLLLACCNVAELPWRAFRERVLAGIATAGRRATVEAVYHEPALDFPTPIGRSPYLKVAVLRLGSRGGK